MAGKEAGFVYIRISRDLTLPYPFALARIEDARGPLPLLADPYPVVSTVPFRVRAMGSPVGPTGHIYVRPEFEITGTGDSSKVKEYLVEFSERVKEGIENGKAPGCLFYDFVWNEDDTKFRCRERYDSPKAMVNHIQYCGDLFPPLFEMGVKCVRFELIGTKELLSDKALRATCAPFDPEYFIQQ